jgi:hypothetical protein
VTEAEIIDALTSTWGRCDIAGDDIRDGAIYARVSRALDRKRLVLALRHRALSLDWLAHHRTTVEIVAKRNVANVIGRRP